MYPWILDNASCYPGMILELFHTKVIIIQSITLFHSHDPVEGIGEVARCGLHSSSSTSSTKNAAPLSSKERVNILNNIPPFRWGGERFLLIWAEDGRYFFDLFLEKMGGGLKKIQVSKQERIGKFKVYTKKFDTRIIQLDNTQFQEAKPGNLIYLSKKV